MMMPILEAVRAYRQTRALSQLSREAFETWRDHALQIWLSERLPQIGYYQGFNGELRDLALMDKSKVLANFSALNQPALELATVRAHWQNGQVKIGRYFIGASTGTSGQRGFFVISAQERYRWLGTILAKALPQFWGHKIAVILPQDNALYRSAQIKGVLSLRFYDLREGPEAWQEALERYAPSVIVAPPKILSHLASIKAQLNPVWLFASAETLEAQDRAPITSYFTAPLRQIYMATEGLFAVECAQGGFHLAEESTYFEFEPVTPRLVSPIITSFGRETQILARYQMNDLLELKDACCPCGSPLRLIKRIHGRKDDVFAFETPKGHRLITPDILRNTILDSAPQNAEFRLYRVDEFVLRLELPEQLDAQNCRAIETALQRVLHDRDVKLRMEIVKRQFPLETAQKLRRIQNLWVP